jgi:hypothetical protein
MSKNGTILVKFSARMTNTMNTISSLHKITPMATVWRQKTMEQLLVVLYSAN